MSLFQLAAFGIAGAGLCRLCPRRLRYVVLLVISFGFYAARALTGLPFLLLTMLTTWAAALRIGRIAQALKAQLAQQALGREEKVKEPGRK